MDIIHWNVNFLIDASYWSCLGADLCFYPILYDYIQHDTNTCTNNPVPETLSILVKNMPGACGSHLPYMVDHGNAATVNIIDVHA